MVDLAKDRFYQRLAREDRFLEKSRRRENLEPLLGNVDTRQRVEAVYNVAHVEPIFVDGHLVTGVNVTYSNLNSQK
jgi:hypothetical protein